MIYYLSLFSENLSATLIIPFLLTNMVFLMYFWKHKLPYYMKRVLIERYTLVICNRQNVQFSRRTYNGAVVMSIACGVAGAFFFIIDFFELIPGCLCYPTSKLLVVIMVLVPVCFFQVCYAIRLSAYFNNFDQERKDFEEECRRGQAEDIDKYNIDLVKIPSTAKYFALLPILPALFIHVVQMLNVFLCLSRIPDLVAGNNNTLTGGDRNTY